MENIEWFEQLVFLKTMLMHEIKNRNNKCKRKRVKEGKGRPKTLDFCYKTDKKKLTLYKFEKNKSYPPRYCSCCDKDVPYISWYQHIRGKRHQALEIAENLGER